MNAEIPNPLDRIRHDVQSMHATRCRIPPACSSCTRWKTPIACRSHCRLNSAAARVAVDGDRTQAAARVHDRGIHFDGGPVQAQHRTAAGIEAAIVFEGGDGDNRRVERVAVDFELRQCAPVRRASTKTAACWPPGCPRTPPPRSDF